MLPPSLGNFVKAPPAIRYSRLAILRTAELDLREGDARQSWRGNAEAWTVKELLEDIAKALVDIPDAVEVREVKGGQVTVFELRVARSDLGKVIGKKGRIAGAIRTILGAAGRKLKRRFSLEILE